MYQEVFMNTYFIWNFDKNVPDYKYIIPLCIQSAFKIVIKIGKLPKYCIWNNLKFKINWACDQDAT